ncbi:MAG: AarF/UbiB family protein, partial [Gammaproteobacteria bacterium]|nr:AarF/UbiB family protein [Gammaproteobacteria bacterium]
MVLGALGATRDLARLHDITSVFIRHGLGDVVRRAGVGGVLERAGQMLSWRESAESAQLDPPERVRMALEELGPTFVKLGQMLSTREDLFDRPWIEQFERLQSQASPLPFEKLLPQIEQTLGRPPQEVFDDLDTTPFASASIAQVHRAKLPSGAPVVLKIRKPGIEKTVAADLRILQHVVSLVESNVPEARRFQPQRILAEFSRSLNRELDL